MFKKLMFVSAAGLLTAAVLTQTKLGSYCWTLADRADQAIESKISPDEEIRRIKYEVSKLYKDIDKAKGSLAEENVEAKLLRQEVEERKSELTKARQALEARHKMMTDVSDGKAVKWDGRDVPFGKAKELLQFQVRQFKSQEQEFKAKETMLTVRERTRVLAEQHLQELVTQKANLDAAIVELEADIKQAKIEQTQSKYQNDGSRMADVKESLAKLKKRIEIQREKLSLSKKLDPTSAENKTVDEIMAELDSGKDVKKVESDHGKDTKKVIEIEVSRD
ncbi:hypothetical protein [Zavarzinella formosa]|uniref:hypothetical protein n=1 Tax=Zavarzinella formosa TaxID=360055 RepID=UPI0002EF7BD1|nr:hypothetical protein [Zavarzinella formosa]